MAKFIFGYSIYCWSKKNPEKEYPVGGAFSAAAARRVIRYHRSNNANLSSIRVVMCYDNQPFDWQNPISERTIKLK